MGSGVRPRVNGISMTGLAAAGMTAMAVASATALAQEATSTGPGFEGLEEIVVTAQRREESLQHTPIAVSAFTTSTLEAIGAKDFIAISGYTPNVNLSPVSGQNGSVLYIRGIGSGDPSTAMDPKVGLYVDGVYVARNTGSVFELDIERIEILRGPQGTLWGKNTTGGSINVITARPRGEFGFTQDLGAGEHGHLRARSVLDLPSTDLETLGTLSTRLSYINTQSDGWALRTNAEVPGPRRLGELDSDSFRFAADWGLTENLNLQYAFDHIRRDGTARQDQLIGAVPGLGVSAYVSRRDRVERFELDDVGDDELDVDGHSLIASWQLGELTLKSITGYRDTELFYDPDLDGTPTQYTATLLSTYQPYTGGLYNVFGERTHEQFSQEFQAIGSSGRVDYVLGLYYFDEDGMESTIGALYYYTYRLFTDMSKTFTIENQSRAAYGQLAWTPPVLDDRLRLILGARYTDDDKDVHKTNHQGLPADMRGEESWSKFSPAATAEFAVNNDVNVYLRIAQGYNAGVFNVRSPAASFNQPADEETLTSYELGMKSEWWEHRLRLNVATFFSQYEDMQQFPYVAGQSIAVNVGDTDLWGAEIEAVARPIEPLTLGLTYGWLDYEINEFAYGGIDVAGQARVAMTPEHNASAFIEYAVPLADLGRLTLRLDGVYKDEASFDSLSWRDTTADDYALLNARITLSEISFDPANVSVSLWGRNLTDEDYQIFAVDFGDFETGTFGDPRTVGVDVRVSF